VKKTIEVEEGALEKLDQYIFRVYSDRVLIRNLGGYEFEPWNDGTTEYEKAEFLAGEMKVLAKAFGLYPYNQPVVEYP